MTGPEHPTPGLSDGAEAVVLGHVRAADIGFLDYLDAWVDKGIADGTLTVAKGAMYREAIAARCAVLGEVPHHLENVRLLDLKPGDVLAVTAPRDDAFLMRQLGEYVEQKLEDLDVKAKIAVFPAGTELAVLHPGPRPHEYPVGIQGPVLLIERYEPGNGTVYKVTHGASGLATTARSYDAALRALAELLPDEFKPLPPRVMPAEQDVIDAHHRRLIADGVLTREQAVAEIREAERREEAWRKGPTARGDL
jgi:hypothetical protein